MGRKVGRILTSRRFGKTELAERSLLVFATSICKDTVLFLHGLYVFFTFMFATALMIR